MTDRTTFSQDDTIVAIITPPGEGGIAALRLAGPQSRAIAQRFLVSPERDPLPLNFFHMHYGQFVDASGRNIDEVTAVAMPHAHSYTGLEQVEIFCHGGRMVVRLILDTLIAAGARPAEPGEFTRLAFLNGRIDLARAEAVAELIAANSRASYETSREHLLGAYSEHISALREKLVSITSEIEASIDFPEEELAFASRDQLLQSINSLIDEIKTLRRTYQGGRIIREGFRIAIGGRPNAGKSSLFNLLLRQERALVNPTPGTTRDYLSEWIELGGFAVNLVDTAGIRKHGGEIEQLGIDRAKKIIKHADLVLWLVDLSKRNWRKLLEHDRQSLPQTETLVVGNKIDTLGNRLPNLGPGSVLISCLTGAGFADLESRLIDEINSRMPDLTSGIVVTSARHRQKLTGAQQLLKSASLDIERETSADVVAFKLRQATNELDEITGRVYTEEILGRIFSKFCIGK